MKKYIFGLLVIALFFVSCTDKEEIEISYQTTLTVSASHIFDNFRATNTLDFSLTGSGTSSWKVNINSYIYDENGSLIDKAEGQFGNLNETLNHILTIKPGNYKIVSIASFTGSYNGIECNFWNISNEKKLQDLTIKESETIFTTPMETLGINTTEITISNKPANIAVNIEPVTGLIQTLIWDDDLSGNGKNGFCKNAEYIEQLNIYAPQIKQIVKFTDGSPSYKYGEQATFSPIMTHSPRTQFLNGGVPTIYSYRALLPIENRDFFWTLKTVSGMGQFLWSDGKDEQQSDMTDNKLNIESGKQYILDLLLDATYLFANNYEEDIDLNTRRIKLQAMYNDKLIDEILEYEQYIGYSKIAIETAFEKEPFYTTENSTAYVGTGLVSIIQAVFTDSTYSKARRIVLMLNEGNQAIYDLITEKLSKKYKQIDSESPSLKQFINGNSLSDSSIGITWDLESWSLYFDAINH